MKYENNEKCFIKEIARRTLDYLTVEEVEELIKDKMNTPSNTAELDTINNNSNESIINDLDNVEKDKTILYALRNERIQVELSNRLKKDFKNAGYYKFFLSSHIINDVQQLKPSILILSEEEHGSEDLINTVKTIRIQSPDTRIIYLTSLREKGNAGLELLVSYGCYDLIVGKIASSACKLVISSDLKKEPLVTLDEQKLLDDIISLIYNPNQYSDVSSFISPELFNSLYDKYIDELKLKIKKEYEDKATHNIENIKKQLQEDYKLKLEENCKVIEQKCEAKLYSSSEQLKKELEETRDLLNKITEEKVRQKEEFLNIYKKYNHEKFEGNLEKNALFDLFNSKVKRNHDYNKDFLIRFLYDLVNEYEEAMEGSDPYSVLYYKFAIMAMQGPTFKNKTKMREKWCVDEFFYKFIEKYDEIEKRIGGWINEYPIETISKLALEIIPSHSATERINYKVCLDELSKDISEHLNQEIDSSILLELLKLMGFEWRLTSNGFRVNITSSSSFDKKPAAEYKGTDIGNNKISGVDFFSSKQGSFIDDSYNELITTKDWFLDETGILF